MGRLKKIPKQQIPVSSAFQRELLGNLSLDQEKDRHRCLSYLPRNIRRFLRYHEKKLVSIKAASSKQQRSAGACGSNPSLSTGLLRSLGGNVASSSFSDAQNEAVEPDGDFPGFFDYIKDPNVNLYSVPFRRESKFQADQMELIVQLSRFHLRHTANSGLSNRLSGKDSILCKCILYLYGIHTGIEQLGVYTTTCQLFPDPSSRDILIDAGTFRINGSKSKFKEYRIDLGIFNHSFQPEKYKRLWPPVPVTARCTRISMEDILRTWRSPNFLYANCIILPPERLRRKFLEVAYTTDGLGLKTDCKLEISIDWVTTRQQSTMEPNHQSFAPRMSGRRRKAPGHIATEIQRSTPKRIQSARIVASYTVAASGQGQKISTIYKKAKFQGLHCPLCLRRLASTTFKTISNLRFHFLTAHPAQNITLREPQSNTMHALDKIKYSFDITPATTQQMDKRALQRPFLWIAPETLFDLSSYITGDDSWLGGSNNSNNSLATSKPSTTAPLPGSRLELLRRVHNGFLPASAIQDIPIRPRKKYPVPTTRTLQPMPLFTSITHRALQADEQLSESDDSVDETWKRDKHAAEIMADETEPLEFRLLQVRWNDHVKSERIASSFYCNDVFWRWVKRDWEWIGENKERLGWYHRFERQLWDEGKVSAGVAAAARRLVYQKKKGDEEEEGTEMEMEKGNANGTGIVGAVATQKDGAGPSVAEEQLGA